MGSPGKGFSLWAVRVRDPALPGIKIEEKPELSRLPLLSPLHPTWPGPCGNGQPVMGWCAVKTQRTWVSEVCGLHFSPPPLPSNN